MPSIYPIDNIMLHAEPFHWSPPELGFFSLVSVENNVSKVNK